MTQAEADEALAAATSEISSNNPEESGLIKCMKIETASTNGTSNIISSTVDEEEKISEADLEDLDQDSIEPTQTSEPNSVSEIFKQRLVAYRKDISKSMIFAD